jgi:hypothetical protein
MKNFTLQAIRREEKRKKITKIGFPPQKRPLIKR